MNRMTIYKTTLIAISLLITQFSPVSAQKNKAGYDDAQYKVWKTSKPFAVMYGNQTLDDREYDLQFKSQFAVGLTKRHTYYLHRKAVGGFMKLGLDVTWAELFFSRYSKGEKISIDNIIGNKRLDIDKYQISYSMFGIGPTIKLAPFARHSTSFKLSGYFHYLPTLSALIFSGDKKSVVCGGYMSNWRFGASISFGRIGIGAEHLWGEGELKKWGSENDESKELGISSDKNKYKTQSDRIYIGIYF